MIRFPLLSEMLIGGAWVDLGNPVRRRVEGGLTITRGRADWNGRVIASRAPMVLENSDAFFSPRRADSPNFELLGRNTQVRHRLRPFYATFTANVANAWPALDTGQVWTNAGGAAGDYSSAGGFARHTHTSVNVYRASTIDVGTTDQYVSVDVKWDIATATGAGAAHWVCLRETDASNHYAVRLMLNTTGTVTLAILKRVAGVLSGIDLGAVTVDASHAAGEWYTIDASVKGNQIRASAYAQGTTPPENWQITVPNADDAALNLSTATKMTLRSRLEAGNTNTLPVVASWDNMALSDWRFWGECASFAPRWDLGNVNVRVPVDAAGIMQRLAAGKSVKKLRSALYRTMSGVAANDVKPRTYHSCEDGQGATQVAAATLATAPATVTGPVEFAADSDLPGSAPLPRIPAGARIQGIVPPYVDTGQWVFQFALRVDARPAVKTDYFEMDTIGTGSTGEVRWRLQLDPTTPGETTIWANSYDASGLLVMGSGVTVGGPFGNGFEENQFYGRWFLFAIAAYHDAFAGQLATTTGFSGNQFTGLSGASLQPGVSGRVINWAFLGAADAAFGHAALYTDPAMDIINDSLANAAALDGYTGEPAARRIKRICDEEQIPCEIIGDPDQSAPCGPQPIDTRLNVLFDAQDVDRGILFEPRDRFGLAYRTARSMLNQSATRHAYTSGYIAAPLAPTEDDQLSENDVTVERPGGSSARTVTTTGRMSVNEPPAGIGVYDTGPKINAATDAQLPLISNRLRTLGSWDEARYPTVGFRLDAPAAAANPALAAAAAALDIGDAFALYALPPWLPPDDVNLLVQGSTEVYGDGSTRDWALNCVPGTPYTTGIYDGHQRRYGCNDTTTAEPLDTTETGVDIVVAAGGRPWITTAGQPTKFPFDIMIRGERMTVTAIVSTGASTYTLTVTRSVNGIVKTHATGQPVRMYFPAFYG